MAFVLESHNLFLWGVILHLENGLREFCASPESRPTLDLYTQDDRDEKQAAKGAYLGAVGLGSRLVQ